MHFGSARAKCIMILTLPHWTPEQAASEIETIRRAGADMLAHPEKHRTYLRKVMAFAKQARQEQELPDGRLKAAKRLKKNPHVKLNHR